MNRNNDPNIKIISNPSAGVGGSHINLPEIRKHFESAFSSVDFSLTNGPGDATRLAEESVENGFHIVVAVGGDGTIREVAAGILGTEAALAAVPVGIQNNFYKSLSKNRSLNDIVGMIRRGKTKLFDTGSIGDGIFINGLEIGIGVEFGKLINKKQREASLKDIIYYGFKASSHYKCPKYKIKLDNTELDNRYEVISIGIGKHFGRGFKWVPYSIENDGLFDICLVRCVGKYKSVNLLQKAFLGKHIDNRNAVLYRSRQILINTSAPIEYNLDGDLYKSKGKEFLIRIKPNSLRVITE